MSTTSRTESAAVVDYPTVTIDQFGRDHWSMLAYVETRCVDGSAGLGMLDFRRLRAHPDRHPLLAHLHHWTEAWGTRLAGFFDLKDRENLDVALASGLQLADHDDWDCLDDLEAAGYVETFSRVNGAVKMTKVGQAMSAELRSHKAVGGNFANFLRAAPVVRERERA